MRWPREIARTLVACLAVGVACSVSNRIDDAPQLQSGDVGPIAEARAESGTRLKARWLVGADGSRQFANWHDTELDTDCTFGVTADGTMRCLPTLVGEGDYGRANYGDAACTQRLFYMRRENDCAEAPPPRFGVVRGPISCGVLAATYFALAGRTQPAHIYSLSAEGECSEISVAPGTDTPLTDAYVHFAAGEELPPTHFVAAEYAIDQ